jgi:hypothetical protein
MDCLVLKVHSVAVILSVTVIFLFSVVPVLEGQTKEFRAGASTSNETWTSTSRFETDDLQKILTELLSPFSPMNNAVFENI